MGSKIQVIEDKKVRSYWDAEAEEWYFSVAGDARKNIEQRIGKTVISPLNASDKNALDVSEDAAPTEE